MKRCINPYKIAAGIFLGYLATPSPVVAQITLDGTVPTHVTRSGNVWEITGGTQAGGNLFHSFSEFSVPTANAAYFNNAPINIFTPGVGITAQAGNNITVNSPITTFGGGIQLTANDASSGTPSGTGSIFINASI